MPIRWAATINVVLHTYLMKCPTKDLLVLRVEQIRLYDCTPEAYQWFVAHALPESTSSLYLFSLHSCLLALRCLKTTSNRRASRCWLSHQRSLHLSVPSAPKDLSVKQPPL